MYIKFMAKKPCLSSHFFDDERDLSLSEEEDDDEEENQGSSKEGKP